VPPENSLWHGECFVFDNRVAVNHKLEKGQYDQCHACRLPITAEDKLDPHYEKGVSCHHCHNRHSAVERRNLRERQRQVELAAARGESHLGSDANLAIEKRRARKMALRAAQQQRAAAAEEPSS